jgi:AcrR family transcriptional regulator
VRGWHLDDGGRATAVSTRRNLQRPREAILEVATQLFGESGYTGTTMREIARAVGVLPGSLYTHIDGKEALLIEIVEGGIDRFIEAVRPLASATGPADQRMRQAIAAHMRVVADNPGRTLVVFHQWRYLTGHNRQLIVRKRREYQDLFSTIVQTGVAEGPFNSELDAHIAVLGILGALNWTPEWFRPDGPAPVDVIAQRIADTLLLGLMAASADRNGSGR